MYSVRSSEINPFTVMQLLQRASEFEAEGKRVVHFEVGEPDFVTAEPIVKAGIAALQEGKTKYTPAQGVLSLREKISKYYAKQGLDIAVSRVQITSGASGGLVLLAGLLLDPGDVMLITDPGYPCNKVFARLVGAATKAIHLEAEHGFQLTLPDVQNAWEDNTKGILLASPSNPIGTMLAANELALISDWVKQQGGFVILDEIYQGLVYGNSPYSSGLQVNDDLLVLNSFSKFFGMTGWRLGWVVIPENAQERFTKLAQNLVISPSSIAQNAALAAFSREAMVIHERRATEFAQRAQRLAKGLIDLGFKIPVMPEGAFYLYVDVSHTGMPSEEFCWRLIEDYQVAVTPGKDFGAYRSDQFVRFAYTTGDDSIDLGLERMAIALRDWGVMG
ncbi:MAG: aminotransferase class I/II-fold pyridoxal phosphate-dependent enzyme [Pseudomonadota bacterium]|nr:aminotransferase class I/II-fold pyridoxal phosphate-dependent enzyme [Pseudomonadota bacterium]